MNKALLTAVTLVSLSAATWAVAGSPDQAHPGGLYAGVSGGWGDLLDSKNSNFASDSSNYALRADAGYLFSLNSNLLAGAEAGYIYFPQYSKTYLPGVGSGKSTSNFYTFDTLGVVKYYVTNSVNVFGKGGLAYVHAVTKTTGKTDKTDAFMPEIATGAGYNITKSLEATVTYAHAFNWNGNNPGFNTVLAGLDYHFSM